MKRQQQRLKPSDLTLLRWAVSQAAQWRGYYVGDPEDPSADRYAAEIERVNAVLRKLGTRGVRP